MTDRQKLEIAAAKARKELRALAMSEDATAEQIAEATAKVDNLEARAAALPDDDPDPEPNKGGDEDAEARELRELAGRVEVRRYIGAAMDGGAVDGAEGEYNAALGMGAGSFPLRLLAPEERATTDTDAGVNQGSWLDRLFAKTCAMHVGVGFRSAGPGVAAYPVTTAGASAAQRGRGEAAADAAWAVGVTEVKPSRNAVRAVFSVEDAARLRGLEDALRRDLRMALTEGIDKAVFLGDGGANENSADIAGLTTAANVSESTITQANKVKWPATVKVFTDLIDGVYASSPADLRIVAAVGAARLWLSTQANSNRNESVAQVMKGNGLSWMTRGGIETATADGDFGAFVGLARGIEGAAVAPVWESARLIRDPYSGASKGEVAITLHTLWGFKLARAANFKRVKFVA
ncbi:MAG: hypothetical protein OXU64_07600 [Gemmatimonadota bacterium]|nr:hypothetical protein [Gemmatimonadota bacterium]